MYLFLFSGRPGDKLPRDIKDFYKSYDAYEGALTAIVLGGFFAFVCLLVMYKTKCKPMWKNRRKRLTTTPATASVAELDDQMIPGGTGGGSCQPMTGNGGQNGSVNPPVIQQVCSFSLKLLNGFSIFISQRIAVGKGYVESSLYKDTY